MEENMQLVQRRKRVHPSTTRLIRWLWVMVVILVVVMLWYAYGSISISAKTENPSSTVETSVK